MFFCSPLPAEFLITLYKKNKNNTVKMCSLPCVTSEGWSKAVLLDSWTVSISQFKSDLFLSVPHKKQLKPWMQTIGLRQVVVF